MNKVFKTAILVLTPVILVFSLLFFSGVLCFGLGCTNAYHFKETAIYYAPKSDLKTIIQTSGNVPKGHDLGIGKADVVMFRTKSKMDTIHLKISTNEGNSITFRTETKPIKLFNLNLVNFIYYKFK